jgi:AAA+ ATPase superfamily predicted ATPase
LAAIYNYIPKLYKSKVYNSIVNQQFSKPDRIFDRVREWDALVRFTISDSPDVRLGIVSGRRRQGKTYLLDAAATAFGGFYFAAADSTETDSLASFGRALADRTGGGRYAFANWDEALQRLFEAVSDGLIIIDEFPYLMKASPSLPSLIQRALGPRGYAQHSRARLVLSGSAMSVMGRLLGGTAPLRGRASLEMIIRPFGYRDAAEFWGIDDPRLALLVHSIVGGTPAYRREFVAGDSPTSLPDFDSWVLRTVLNPQLPLFREARYLLAEETSVTEVRDTALYHAVLGAIASGNATRGGIANHIGRKATDIGHPLAVLEDSQLITRETDPFRKGRSLYRITEPLIVFYEAVMRREWTRLERGDTAGAWRNSQATFLAQVAGPHFETICRDWAQTSGADAFGEATGEVAAGVVADPLRRSQIEIDAAAFAPDDPGCPRRVLSLGEAKWDKVMTLAHLERLRRARDLLAVKGYDMSATRLTCYTGAGFDPDLGNAARDDADVQLIELDALYG